MAANVTIQPDRFTTRDCPPHAVYTRELWGQNWVKTTWLFCDRCTFNLPPQIGQATLRWRFGRGMRQGEQQLGIVSRLQGINRHWVKIVFDLGDDVYLNWFGMIDLLGEENKGLVQSWPSATQPITCQSLEYAFYRWPVRQSVWRDSTTGAEKTIDRALVFNGPRADGSLSGNRSSVRGLSAFLFADQIGVEDEPWSTRTIAEYLVEYCAPRGVNGMQKPRWRWDAGDELLAPDWDKPVIDPHGQTLGEVLDQLFPRGRLLGWRLFVDTSDPAETDEPVRLKPVSWLGADVATPLGVLRANPFRLHLEIDTHPDYRTALRDSTMDQVDQVRIRSARRTTTCTLSDADDSVGKGFPADLEQEYEEAFSTDGSYGTLSTDERQLRNAEVRSAEHLDSVFARFAIPDDWDQTVKDGLGGGDPLLVFPVNPGAATPAVAFPVCPRELFVEKTLPMLMGFNYENVTIPAMGSQPEVLLPPVRVSTGPHIRLPPLVLFKVPGSDDPDPEDVRYVPIHKLAHNAGVERAAPDDERWFSCQVDVAEMDRAVLLRVFGRPQHAIAYTDFDPLDEDYYVGAWDWRDALFTVALSDDRFCEGVYPAEADVPPAVVGVRRELLLHVPGDRYRQDYIVPGTVIGVDPAGALVRCEAGGWLNNDSKLLTARAQLLYEYFSQQRRALVVQTNNLDTDIEVGDYIESLEEVGGDRTIGTVVTQIEIVVPDGDGPISITYTTDFAELDEEAILA